MKIRDIISEKIDQDEANQVLQSLIAAGDPTARYFQITRYQTVHTTIDSAQRAAERMYHRDRDAELARRQDREEKRKDSDTQPDQEPKRLPRDDDSRIGRSGKKWGNQYYSSGSRSKIGSIAKDIVAGSPKAAYNAGKQLGGVIPFDNQINRGGFKGSR